MGCCSSNDNSSHQEPENKTQTYSWDRDDRPDPKELIFQNLSDVTVGKLPGSLSGNSFSIENCQNSKLYIFDHVGAITIDDCVDCDIFVGPVKGSIFVRDCRDCRLLVSCQQFRSRDCRNICVSLHCCSQPVIENSTGMKFSSYRGTYSGFEDHFAAARLSAFRNEWASVHDFTRLNDIENWAVTSQDDRLPIAVPDDHAELAGANFTFEQNYLPRPLGGIKFRPAAGESCLVVLSSAVHCGKVLRWLSAVADQVTLVQTAELTLSREGLEGLIPSCTPGTFLGSADSGTLVLMEFSGASCIGVLRGSIQSEEPPSLSSEQVYLSPSAAQGQSDLEAWDSVANLSFMP